MKPTPLPRARARRARHHLEAGFNLIEVSIAVAIVGVGMLVVFGLTGGAVDASRRVADETVVTQIMGDVVADRLATNYTAISYNFGLPSLESNSVSTLYFTMDGALAQPTIPGGSTYSNAYFRIVTVVTNSSLAANSPDLARLFITATYPVSPIGTNTLGNVSTRVTFAQIARRQQ